ncbi:MAG: hypothetical protein PUP46_01460, partial [Endozoicomonas sp. (ex Botrylloides leachii)]|nr:hypothetical protein [Endozoicomonas sp. (ex Botrylloides leachii)]
LFFELFWIVLIGFLLTHCDTLTSDRNYLLLKCPVLLDQYIPIFNKGNAEFNYNIRLDGKKYCAIFLGGNYRKLK